MLISNVDRYFLLKYWNNFLAIASLFVKRLEKRRNTGISLTTERVNQEKYEEMQR